MKLTCLASCGSDRAPGQYLCRTCWGQLPATAQQRLNRRDRSAFLRLRELSRQIEAGVPLPDVTVTA
jgi:hypothetical protein